MTKFNTTLTWGLSSSGAENLHRPVLAKALAVDRLLYGFM